jgi:processive 1,2-diacylglycerol beta-glucosyltransferase
MTKVLILYASMGSGHVGAANSVAEALGQLGVTKVRVENGLDYTYSFIRTMITKGYPRISELFPYLWRRIYEGTDNPDLKDALRSNAWMGEFQVPFYRRLETLINEMDPDAIICTQQFPLMIVQALKNQARISQPNYVAITDFTAHSSWLSEDVEAYFVASEFTREALALWGVPEKRLHATGIPVKLEVSQPKSMADIRHKLDLPRDIPVVTLFGSGMLPKRVRRIVEAMLVYPDPLVFVTVDGRNHHMTDVLDDLRSNDQVTLRKYAYIDFVDDLVAASDLVVTKSGGMITSEVLARGTPMIVVDPIPGQEECNADFLAGSGAGIQIRRPEMVPAAILGLLDQPGRLESMRAQARAVGRPHAALDIAEHVLADLAKSSGGPK